MRLLRQCDVVGRTEDEGLIAVLPETDRRAARVVAERLRSGLERDPPHVEGIGTADFVRLNIGVAAFPINGELIENAVTAARAALARARSLGGNTVAVSDQFVRSDEAGEPLMRQVRGEKS